MARTRFGRWAAAWAWAWATACALPVAPARAADDPAPAEPAPAPAPAPAPEPAPAEPAAEPAPEDPDRAARDAREAELFGGGSTEPAPDGAPAEPAPTAPAPPPAPTGDRDDDLLGGGFHDAEDDLGRRLAALDDRLTFGGRLWLQAVGHLPEGVDAAEDVTLDAPNLLDLFVDARPNDRLRAYARARLQHDWTVRAGDVDPLTGEPLQPDTVLLDQMWAKFDVGRLLFVTAGRQRIRWGAGRFWNPTDFLNQQRLDPLAVVDVRTGVDLLKLHLPLEPLGANLYAVANLTDARALDELGGAARVEWAFAQTEVTASAAVRKDQPVRLGADVSSGIGPFDVRLEGAAIHGVTEPGWTGAFDPATLTFPTEVDRSDTWFVQGVAGADVSIKVNASDTVLVGVEGFYNGPGQPDATLYPWLALQGQFVPLYLGQGYGAAYVLVAAPGNLDDHTFIGSVLADLSDRSALARLDWRFTALTWLEVSTYVAWHFGDNGEFHYAIEVPPLPLVPGLEDGLSVPAPLLDVGLGAILRF